MKILEEGFWDSLTVSKEEEPSGTSINDELSNLFFRHLDFSDSKSSSTSSTPKRAKPDLSKRVMHYLSENCELLYPGGTRLESKTEALDLFSKVEPWSKFVMKDLVVRILGREKENESDKEVDGRVALLTYKVKARTEEMLYEALCHSTWIYEAVIPTVEEDKKENECSHKIEEGNWKMILHQQTPVK